ncbi:hypothetical protein KA005_56985 [bacterium]|nr:hypothetical protein [bacterium]
MDYKIKKIAKKRDLSEKFVETIIAGADSGFLKGWRELVYHQKVQIWNLLETKNEPEALYRLQGQLSAYRKIENRIDEVLEDYKNVKK